MLNIRMGIFASELLILLQPSMFIDRFASPLELARRELFAIMPRDSSTRAEHRGILSCSLNRLQARLHCC